MSEQLIERAQDTTGLLRSIKNDVGDYARLFVDLLVTEVADENQVTLSADLQRQVVDQILREGPRLAPGQLQPHVLDVIGRVRQESATWAASLDAFLKSQNLSPSPRERQRLLRRLNAKVLRPGDIGSGGSRAVFFGEVLDELRGERDGADDPVSLVAAPRAIEPWDFRVNLFEESELQPVLPANIRATGALTWCYDIGERMGLYPLTDALVLRWWTGQVDFADPTLISELYRYYKLSADQRPTKEDRGQLYHRILATGGTEVIGRATVNESFPALWRSLMEEVTRYVTKEETAARDNRVNRRAIYQATRELQYNLTASMQGMALLQVTEMYKQLDQDPGSGQLGALQILGHPEVVDQLSSGRRRSVWSVVERLAQEEFDVVPNVAALRTSASEGYRVFEWIADFDDGTVDEARFTAFVDSATAWILSQEASESDLAAVVEEAAPDAEFDEDVPEFADTGAW